MSNKRFKHKEKLTNKQTKQPLSFRCKFKCKKSTIKSLVWIKAYLSPTVISLVAVNYPATEQNRTELSSFFWGLSQVLKHIMVLVPKLLKAAPGDWSFFIFLNLVSLDFFHCLAVICRLFGVSQCTPAFPLGDLVKPACEPLVVSCSCLHGRGWSTGCLCLSGLAVLCCANVCWNVQDSVFASVCGSWIGKW